MANDGSWCDGSDALTSCWSVWIGIGAQLSPPKQFNNSWLLLGCLCEKSWGFSAKNPHLSGSSRSFHCRPRGPLPAGARNPVAQRDSAGPPDPGLPFPTRVAALGNPGNPAGNPAGWWIPWFFWKFQEGTPHEIFWGFKMVQLRPRWSMILLQCRTVYVNFVLWVCCKKCMQDSQMDWKHKQLWLFSSNQSSHSFVNRYFPDES